jgi:hypothetical protein
MSTHLDAAHAGLPVPALNFDMHRLVNQLKTAKWD